MSADLAKKTCKMCGMEIPQVARKCPFCQHFQNRWVMLMFHPASIALFACLPIVAILIFFHTILDPGENFETYKDQIAITDRQITFGDTKSGGTVAIIGTIKNTSPIPWKEIHFHADFFDAQGHRTDVAEEHAYNFYLPANGTSSFKISFRREFPESSYVKQTIRIVTAKDAKSRW